jgi:hypothetical protein
MPRKPKLQLVSGSLVVPSGLDSFLMQFEMRAASHGETLITATQWLEALRGSL